MRYYCCDERRRHAVRATEPYNGIEFLEVVDTEADLEEDRQRVLRVHFLKPPPPPADEITRRDVHIRGGTRVTGIDVLDVEWDENILIVRVDRPGDYSIYKLHVGDQTGEAFPGIDPMLASVEFSFKIECPTGFDCEIPQSCPPDLLEPPEIDYLARDYASFRRLMLDRLSTLMPEWDERNPADIGIALVEALAYRADHLSYTLDAIGMEATLETARHRKSARRHARLVDYQMHDGANARAWVHVRVSAASVELPGGTVLLSRVPGIGDRIVPHSQDERRALQQLPIIFETMHDAVLHDDLNELDFYTWGNRECCLPAGATSATIRGHHEDLQAGAVLVFMEQIGAKSGVEADRDPDHRHVVRLIDAHATVDPIGGWFEDQEEPIEPLPVTEIYWAEDDALPFPLCISGTDVNGTYHDDISVVLGNIVLADHGQTMTEELPPVPRHEPRLAAVPAGSGSHCAPADPIQLPSRYTPLLDEGPLTTIRTTGRFRPEGIRRQFERFDSSASASDATATQMERLLPEIHLEESGTGRRWYPRQNLLASGQFDFHFVAEVDSSGRARLRFGDSEFGMRPRGETEFTAVYRIGNGTAGNIGADALSHIVSPDSRVESVTNPLPANGGERAESIEHVRRTAPNAFWVQKRAVTPDDYAEVAERHREVHRAIVTERWTGSWYTMFLTLDRTGGKQIDPEFEDEIRAHLEQYRMAGHDISIDGPRFVWLELELRVCVWPDYYRGDVRRNVFEVLSSGFRPDGSRGFFHPDRFTFGQSVFLSQIYAAVQDVTGVRFVEALVFQRYGDSRTSALESGELKTGRLEIARLDNDPSFPEHGELRLNLEGGR